MRQRLLLALACVAVAVSVWAQSAPRVYWTHDGVGVTRFEIVVDGTATTDVGLPTPTGTTYSAALPTMAAGQHSLVVRACDDTTCTASAPIALVVLGPDE